MAQRAAYRFTPHGKIDAEGHQRFTHPNPRGCLAWDSATGKPTRQNPTGKVTMRLDDESIRHLQKYPWPSTAWFRASGQRNQVEASNTTLKDQNASNIGDKAARPARGFAYTSPGHDGRRRHHQQATHHHRHQEQSPNQRRQAETDPSPPPHRPQRQQASPSTRTARDPSADH